MIIEIWVEKLLFSFVGDMFGGFEIFINIDGSVVESLGIIIELVSSISGVDIVNINMVLFDVEVRSGSVLLNNDNVFRGEIGSVIIS